MKEEVKTCTAEEYKTEKKNFKALLVHKKSRKMAEKEEKKLHTKKDKNNRNEMIKKDAEAKEIIAENEEQTNKMNLNTINNLKITIPDSSTNIPKTKLLLTKLQELVNEMRTCALDGVEFYYNAAIEVLKALEH